jgi:hypothetical protein
MSIYDSIFNPGCGQEIYDTPDEQTFVNCQIGKAKIGLIVATIIIFCIILFVYYSDSISSGWKAITYIGGPLLIAGIAFVTFTFTEKFARVDYQRFTTAIDNEVKNLHIDRPSAVANYIQKIQRDKDREVMSRASSNSNVSTGLLGIGLLSMLNSTKKKQ